MDLLKTIFKNLVKYIVRKYIIRKEKKTFSLGVI